jgi:hypothetical protein
MNGLLTQEKRTSSGRIFRIAKRMILFVVVGLAIGWALHHAEALFERRQERAGFVRGIVQGALMPIALPNLLFGNDVAIYAVNNTGRTYKLGYTMGVNGCGLIFFGFFFWRLRRLRAEHRAPSTT